MSAFKKCSKCSITSASTETVIQRASKRKPISVNNLYENKSIGRVCSAAETSCGLTVNLLSPPEKFRNHTELLFDPSKFTCEKSMRNPIEKATRLEGSRDVDIALDGSWQKRGHQSLNGIVTATSFDTTDSFAPMVFFNCFRKNHRCKTAFTSAHEPSCIAINSGLSGGIELKLPYLRDPKLIMAFVT
ncbi:hypothetical protein TNCV_4464851 [Trichonephila clavipes]|nr:hypothetical protein TNCV_4464851 [Trichonephila clavipes]